MKSGMQVQIRGEHYWCTPDLMADLLAVAENFPVPRDRLAADIGITPRSLGKLLHRAQKRRWQAARAEAAMLRAHGWTLK